MLIVRPKKLFRAIVNTESLPFWKMVLVAILGAGIYGGVLGGYSGRLMILYAALKVPLVIISTTIICFPAMYVIGFGTGLELSIKQIGRLVFHNLYLLALGLCALSPVIWFWQNFYPDYRFNVLMLVATFSLAWVGAIYLTWENLSVLLPRVNVVRLLAGWCVLFAFVSTQMIWLFRPWVGYTYVNERLPFIRSVEGDIYNSVFLTLKTWTERNLN